MQNDSDITLSYIRQVLLYRPTTGVFVWKERKTRQDLVGCIAGSIGSHGYLAIGIFNRKRLAHRLAWFYTTGSWPKAHIDHIDGNKRNNCFANLREVTQFGNLQNMRQASKRNKARLLGVSLHQGKWRVQIMTRGQSIRISGFNTPEEAHQKYLLLKRDFHLTCSI
jgi:hypothetical protein